MPQRRIVYFGMSGIFSAIPLRGLIEAGHTVEAVVMPRPAADARGLYLMPQLEMPVIELPMVQMPVSASLMTEASRFNIPVYSLGRLATPNLWTALAGFEAELWVTACFPRIFPEGMLAVPPQGALNLHPSRLPDYRGPDPIFWQLHEGELNPGVSIHFMTPEIDGGPLAAQYDVAFPDGADPQTLDRICAEALSGLLVELMSQEQIPTQPQDQNQACYFGSPEGADRVISVLWTARRAYNFMRGAAAWAPFQVEMRSGEHLTVHEALEIVEAAPLEGADAGWVEFVDGWVRVS